jgi:hypothetical protein
VGVGDLAPWHVGPPEQAGRAWNHPRVVRAIVRAGCPTAGPRGPVRGGGVAGAHWAAMSARMRGGRGRPQGWELGRARVGPGREKGALGRAGGGGGRAGEGNGGGPAERAREGEAADFPFSFLYLLLLFQFDII